MLKRPLVIVFFLLCAAMGAYVYLTSRTPPGTVGMSENAETVATIGLTAAVVSLIASVIGLIQKIIEVWQK